MSCFYTNINYMYMVLTFALYTKWMVVGDLGLSGMLAPWVVAVENKRGRGNAIIQNLSAMVQIVLLMDQPVRTLKNAMTMIVQVSKRSLLLDDQLFYYVRIWIYSDISKLQIEYLNIFVCSKINIHIRISDIRRTIFEYIRIFLPHWEENLQ